MLDSNLLVAKESFQSSPLFLLGNAGNGLRSYGTVYYRILRTIYNREYAKKSHTKPIKLFNLNAKNMNIQSKSELLKEIGNTEEIIEENTFYYLQNRFMNKILLFISNGYDIIMHEYNQSTGILKETSDKLYLKEIHVEKFKKLGIYKHNISNWKYKRRNGSVFQKGRYQQNEIQ